MKADVSAHDNWPIGMASSNGHLEIVKYLVSIKADVSAHDNRAFYLASSNGHLETVKYLVSIVLDTVDYNYATRLACYYGNLNVVKHLVSIGADVTLINNCAIRQASENGYLSIVEYLLSIGADINQLLPEHKIFFRQKRAYSKWRRIHLKNWIRKVLIPLYYSPKNRGGVRLKEELMKIIHT